MDIKFYHCLGFLVNLKRSIIIIVCHSYWNLLLTYVCVPHVLQWDVQFVCMSNLCYLIDSLIIVQDQLVGLAVVESWALKMESYSFCFVCVYMEKVVCLAIWV